MDIMVLEDAIEEIMNRSPQASDRLDPIADFAIEQLRRHGLPDARGGSGSELTVKGLARPKKWDVAYAFADKPRLLVSLKSIWKNAGGTVPNRTDDLMGESANVQQVSPEIVIGYILLFDANADALRRDGLYWSQYFESAVKSIAIRKAPLWNQGLLEGTWFIKFDSTQPTGSRVVDPSKARSEGEAFFVALLSELKMREPAIPFSRHIQVPRTGL